MTVAQIEKLALSKRHFAAIYHSMKLEQDEKNAEKVMDLFEKFKAKQYHVCFAGHFSAGKSSMINYLLGKDILPKSPIPTSANIVKITAGEGVARVFFNDVAPVQYKEPYNIDVIKDYCMDRDTIKRIEISLKEDLLPEKSALLDTPGIDAADDADRLMTESSLHLIDALFYVMDYNHVQSEVNLYFLQNMQKQGIPIYLIINQIDKHNEAELAFSDYKTTIKQTFDQWGIFPEKIYYSSMYDHPENEIKQIKSDIFYLLGNGKVTEDEINRSIHTVIHDHQRFIREQVDLPSTDPSEVDHVTEKLNTLKDQLQVIKTKENGLKDSFYDEIQTTLKNAYLMPATLRDLAGSFLKTQEKDFKVGFFKAKKKTEVEKEEKFTAFQQALQKTYETTIQWKIREKTLVLLQDMEVTDPTVLKNAQEYSISFGESDIFSFLKAGAMVNGNYILNYTNDISNAIKNKFRSAANDLWRQIEQNAMDKWQQEKHELEKNVLVYQEQQAKFDKNELLNEKITEKEAEIIKLWEHPELGSNMELFNKFLDEKNQIITEKAPEKIVSNDKSIINEEKHSPVEEPLKEASDVSTITHAIDKVVNEIADMSAFSALVNDLRIKKDRLENRELTIALFGTFSAGKSSFSNALFGERILPVSPNPTTAVISRIRPMTEKYGHGTVRITLKDETALMDDLMMITKHMGSEKPTLENWVEWIENESIYEHQELTNTYQAYLRAIVAGYDEQKEHVGSIMTISLDEFAAFVTDETKACYIQHVDLYYHCSITRKGITLVDTPGADSVNARHTSVAFDYIKEADAILYVTYYNHAITSGDRDFLMQLGRVKDAFAMDKMFFIVNASDLAESKSDLELVVHYVTDQLIQFGIRHAKIFPVSSKVSLEEKLAGIKLNEEMSHFEKVFYNFIDQDLIALTKESAIWEMNRAKTSLTQFIQSSELDESARNVKVTELTHQGKNSTTAIQQLNKSVFQSRINDRIDRQLHFVLDRLYIRFHDMFTEYFNPSTIHNSGKKAQELLEQQRNQFIDYVGYELLQEIRAVAIRVEIYMDDLITEAYTIHQQDAFKINDTFALPSLEKIRFETPKFKQAFEQIDMGMFKQALKIFKNTKSFFEQNEREKMKETFYDLLQPHAKTYVTEAKQVMENVYEEQWLSKMQTLQERAIEEITVIVNEHIHLLTNTVDVVSLKGKHRSITHVLNQFDEG